MIDQNQKRFLSSFAAIFAKMANADGVITGDEVVAVGAIWQRLGLTPEQSLYCTEQFKKAAEDNVSLKEYIEAYISSKYGSSTRILIYELLWEVACSDGVLHRNEARALKDLVGWLGVRKESFEIYYSKCVAHNDCIVDEEKEEIKRRHEAEKKAREKREKEESEERFRKECEELARREREKKKKAAERKRAEAERRKREEEAERQRKEQERKARDEAFRKTPLGKAYAILGCSPSDSDEKIKRAYRTLALKNHPDSLLREGVLPEIIAQATAKMAEINSAWSVIRKARGI